MPLPFILAGIAIAAASYGVKKGFDAKSDYDEADRVNERAKDIYDTATRKLNNERKETNNALENLGRFKFELYDNRVIPFSEAFSKIKNIEPKEVIINGEKLTIKPSDILAINDTAMQMKEVVSGGIAALGTGGLTGLAAYGGVGMFASASTGTAIAGLSGAAATNATLAWLGGGALSAGGLGIAGGTAILGGIVAGPVLAIGGMMLASKAEESKHNAYSNLSKAKEYEEEMRFAQTKTLAIHARTSEMHDTLK